MTTSTDNNIAGNNAATVAANTNANAKAKTSLNANYQDFLKLLTTQLQNQDPTAPADTNQLTQQIATLSQVEQQINTNNQLTQLISLFSSTQINAAVGYIGKQVDAEGNKIVLSEEKAALVYELPAAAKSADITITNSAGQSVFTGSGTVLAGRNQVLWSGLNTITGQPMPSGAYNFSVKAKDANGKDMEVTTFTTGTVTAVETQDGTPSLSLGYLSLPLSSVQSIYTSGTNPGV